MGAGNIDPDAAVDIESTGVGVNIGHKVDQNIQTLSDDSSNRVCKGNCRVLKANCKDDPGGNVMSPVDAGHIHDCIDNVEGAGLTPDVKNRGAPWLMPLLKMLVIALGLVLKVLSKKMTEEHHNLHVHEMSQPVAMLLLTLPLTLELKNHT